MHVAVDLPQTMVVAVKPGGQESVYWEEQDPPPKQPQVGFPQSDPNHEPPFSGLLDLPPQAAYVAHTKVERTATKMRFIENYALFLSSCNKTK